MLRRVIETVKQKAQKNDKMQNVDHKFVFQLNLDSLTFYYKKWTRLKGFNLAQFD